MLRPHLQCSCLAYFQFLGGELIILSCQKSLGLSDVINPIGYPHSGRFNSGNPLIVPWLREKPRGIVLSVGETHDLNVSVWLNYPRCKPPHGSRNVAKPEKPTSTVSGQFHDQSPTSPAPASNAGAAGGHTTCR